MNLAARLLCLSFALLALPAHAQRTFLTPTTKDFYVSKSGSDANDCRQATPCLTIQRAVDNVKQNYDSNCLQPWIRVAHGGSQAYAGWQDYAPQVGCQPHGGGPLVIAGDCGNLPTIRSQSGVAAISLDGGAVNTVVCFIIESPNAPAVYATNGGIIEVGNLVFTDNIIPLMADAKGSVFVTGNVNLNGSSMIYGMQANIGGLLVVVPGVTVTINGTIGEHLVFASNMGMAVVGGVNWVNNGTIAQACYASILGYVNAFGTASAIPGTAGCDANYGGQVY